MIPLLNISRYNSKTDNQPQSDVLLWEDLRAELTQHQYRRSKDGPLWSPSQIAKGETRANENVVGVCCFVADVDDKTPPEALFPRWRGLAWCIHSSYSSTSEHPKWRLVIPLARPVPAKDWPAVHRRLVMALVDGHADPSCKDTSRMYYFPSCPKETLSEAFADFGDGEFISPDDFTRYPQPPQDKVKRATPQTERRADWEGERVGGDHLIECALAGIQAYGGRNNAGFWLACQLRDNGYSEVEADSYILDYARRTPGGSEPYTDDEALKSLASAFKRDRREPWAKPEVRQMKRSPSEVKRRSEAVREAEQVAASIDRQNSDDPAPIFLKSDTGNADRFIYRHGSRLRYDHSRKAWFIWTGKRWQEDRNNHTQELAKETVRSIYTEAAGVMGDDERRASLAKFAVESDKVARIAALLSLATSDPKVAVTSEDWDKDPFLLNCQNGTVDLRTGCLRTHDASDLLTKICPVDYDPDTTAPLWAKCLERWQPDPEVRAFLQRAAGYTLTGHTGEETAFFCYGGGRNGKSKFTGAIETMLGDYAARIPIEVLIDSRKAGNATPELIPIIGARLVLASEITEARRLNEAFVKDATGGDPITARAMYAGMITFRPQFKLWLYGNHKPTLRGNDEGIKSRLPLVPWTVTIPADERDAHLSEKLNRELSGILAWAVRGCLEWQRRRLSPPSAVVQATEEYHSNQDVFGQFLTECCILGTGRQFWAKSADLRRVYEQWMEERGDRFTLNGNQFAERLQQAGAALVIRKIGGKTTRTWEGIALPADTECSEEGARQAQSQGVVTPVTSGYADSSKTPHGNHIEKVTKTAVTAVTGVTSDVDEAAADGPAYDPMSEEFDPFA